eukprot:s1431_g6.t3
MFTALRLQAALSVVWMASAVAPQVELSNGRRLPLLGLGCASGVRRSHVESALRLGYRLLDTAQADQWGYHEDEVGEAIQGLPREEIFLQSKIHPEDLGYASTKRAFQVSLDRLKTSYLDAMLLHKPWCWPGACSREPEGTWQDSWRALEELHAANAALAIGICDVDVALLSELLRQRQKPHIVQNWMDPFHQDKELRRRCKEEGIQYQAYSTLGTQWVHFRGYRGQNPVLNHPVLQKIAQFHHRSVAQVVLNWAQQQGVSVIPASTDSTRQRLNLESFNFTLRPEDLMAIDALDGALDHVDPKEAMMKMSGARRALGAASWWILEAALAFAQHLLSRANFVQTFCKDGQNAWIIKHSDLQESLQEIGRRMLQWAIVSTADQVASGRERIAQKAHGAQQAEEKLLQVRLALWHQRRDIRLNAMVSDRVPREIFELDRLHRSHRAICSAALEAEHRCCVSLHEQIVEKLGSLDDALSYSQNCFRDYRKEMHQGVQLEMRNLKQLLSNQLLKMQPQTLTVQNALKRIDKDDRDDPQVGAALKRPEPVQPQSAASTYFGTPASESYVEAAIIGPKRPALRPGAQLQRKAALEDMHHEIAQMLAAGTRVHTFYDLKCQQLKQYYDEELHRLCGTLSSNREVWENVSEGRERQRLLAEEIARSQRRCEDANGEAKVMRKAIDEHEEYTKKMFHWKRKMMKAQGDLQHEMRKYERDGLVDVSKMESELGKLDAQLQQLSTSVPAEQIIDLIERRGRTERMDMKRTMKHEGYLLHKAAAKVQVIRSELEKGAQDQEDEPFAELLMEECNTLSRQIMELDQENKDLQSQLLKTGEIDLIELSGHSPRLGSHPRATCLSRLDDLDAPIRWKEICIL